MAKSKYKTENWKTTKWKGQTRQQQVTVQRLVSRDAKGHFSGKNPVITKLQTKVYGSGVYQVGIINNKIVLRHKIASRNIEWHEKRKELEQKNEMYRTSYVLNNIPISKNGYFGFRIVAFSLNKNYLDSIKQKLKDRLIKFIEETINYQKGDFWFDMYFGYEAPTKTNASLKENDKGMILKEESGRFHAI